MMENPQWPSNNQQSVASNVERTTDSLNNGNGDSGEYVTGAGAEKSADSGENAGKDDPENGVRDATEQLGVGNHPSGGAISDRSQQMIQSILEKIRTFSPLEKFLLYLKLPTEIPNGIDPLRQPLNPLGNRSEIYRTISWIRTHLKEDPETSLPKQEVYTEYNEHCSKNKIKPLSQADFGKVMKQVYPKVRARRLGVRGQSKYCYAGLIRCTNLSTPSLSDVPDKPISTEPPCTQSSLALAAWFIVKQWSEKQLGKEFSSLESLAFYLVVEHSIGTGTKAANQLKNHCVMKDDDPLGGKCLNKRRETQLQLQKKILEANKKRKRKIQCPKQTSEERSGKKARPLSVSAPVSRQGSSELSPVQCEPPTSTTGARSSSNSAAPSPTQGKPICDKSLDFTHQPALPDFNSFQKPAHAHAANTSDRLAKVAIPRLMGIGVSPGKMSRPLAAKANVKYKAIQPKPCDIASYNNPQQHQQQVVQQQQQQQQQPQPQQVIGAHAGPDSASVLAVDIRSQTVHNIDKYNKERKGSDDDCDVPELPLPRERLESISNVDKDAMDEYLGTNNSQHEEELSKYFGEDNVSAEAAEAADNNVKLSQLRQILEQNGIAADGRLLSAGAVPAATAAPDGLLQPSPVAAAVAHQPPPHVAPVVVHPPYLPPHMPAHLVNSSARRRVSFETHPHHHPHPHSHHPHAHHAHQEEAVPPSPNTRRKNFSFTPISPGPQSPTTTTASAGGGGGCGRQSKPSSTNASPFVSPRNTPVPRCKIPAHHQAAGGMGAAAAAAAAALMPRKGMLAAHKVKKELPDREAPLDIPLELKEELASTYTSKDYMAVSAPPSPRHAPNPSMLQKLLNSSNKVAYTPDYINSTVPQSVAASAEIGRLLMNAAAAAAAAAASAGDPPVGDLTFRSHSVPVLASMKNTAYPLNENFMLADQNPDFNDLDTIPETQSEVNQIISTLEDPAVQAENNNIDDMNVYSMNTGDNLNQYGLIIEGNLELAADFTGGAVQFEEPLAQDVVVPCVRGLARSQSMDVVGTFDSKCPPSRSVPSTPLPYVQNIQKPLTVKAYPGHVSRSYPSTPVVTADAFNYNHLNLNRDCLLNGQPIRNDQNTLNGLVGAAGEWKGTDDLEQDKGGFGIEGQVMPADEFNIVENDNSLMDDNCILISDQNFNTTIN